VTAVGDPPRPSPGTQPARAPGPVPVPGPPWGSFSGRGRRRQNCGCRAVALAQQSGNEDTAKLLAKVVDVVDAATGTVRLKNKVEDADEMALDTRSTKTVRTRK
jgi:hypothetical protein